MEGRNAFAVMVLRAGTITESVLLLIGLAGCALLGRKSLVEPGALQGRIENNIYTSPQESFRIRIPWLAADATVSDETSADNSVNVTIADNLCREFTVSQRPGFLGTQSLESWVDTHIVADLKRLNFWEIQSLKGTEHRSRRNRTAASSRRWKLRSNKIAKPNYGAEETR